VAWSTGGAVTLKIADGGRKDLLNDSVGSEIGYGSGGILVAANSGGAGSALLCRETGGCSRLQQNITSLKRVTGDTGNAQMLSNGGSIYSCVSTGECGSARLCVRGTEGPFVDFAVLGGLFFWVTGKADGRVRSVPRTSFYDSDGGYGPSGSPITDLATGVASPLGIATDSSGVVWTESGSGHIRRCAVSVEGSCVGAPVTIYEGTAQDAPSRVVSDGQSVYWIAATARSVLRCAASGCVGAPMVIMQDLAEPTRIALSLDRVYVADIGTSRVLSAPK